MATTDPESPEEDQLGPSTRSRKSPETQTQPAAPSRARMTKSDLVAELESRDTEVADLLRVIADLRNKAANNAPHLSVEGNTPAPDPPIRNTPAAPGPLRRESTVETRMTAGGQHQRSAKLPDPPIFYNEEDRDTEEFEQWYRDMRNKLEVNADHFPGDRARQAYIESRLGGTAKRELAPYLSESHPEPVDGPEALFEHLWAQYRNPNKREEALNAFEKLKLEPGGNFLTFKNSFVRLAGETGRVKSTWKEELNRKLYPSFQRTMASSYINPAVNFDHFVREAQMIALINKKASEDRAARQPATKKAAASGGAASDRRKPAAEKDSAKKERLTTEEREVLKKEGRCFTCREKGHLSSECPKKQPRAAEPDLEARVKNIMAGYLALTDSPASKENARPKVRFEEGDSEPEN